MEYFVLIVLAILLAAVITVGIYLVCPQMQDYCAINANYRELVTRTGKTRLGRMLRNLNINLHDYVRAFQASEVTDHLNTCKHCDSWKACDMYLSGKQQSSKSVRAFCPNLKEFDGLLEDAADKPV